MEQQAVPDRTFFSSVCKKDLSIEIMRIMACFFVIFNHTSQNGFFLFSVRPIGSLQYWIDLFISVFCKFAVPLFFAISGALLIPKEDSLKKTLWRIIRAIIVLTLFSFLYYFVEVYNGNETFDFSRFLLKLYCSNWNGTYWYLYAYIPFLITLPLLRSFAKGLDSKWFIYMFVIGFLFRRILPVIEYLANEGKYHINDYFGNNLRWIYINIVEFPLLGYFLNCRIRSSDITRKQLAIMWTTNVITIIISSYLTYYKQSKGQGLDQAFHETFVVINVLSLFLTTKKVFGSKKINIIISKMICCLGECTFGIYLLHVLILLKWNWTNELWTFFNNKLGINQMFTAFIVCFIVMLIGFIPIYILKKLPILKKLL